MGEHLHTLIHKLQFLVAGTLIFVIFFLISLIVSTVNTNNAQGGAQDADTSFSMGGANAVAAGMSNMVTTMQQGFTSAMQDIGGGLQTAGSATVHGFQQVGRAIGSGAANIVGGVGNGLVLIGNTVADSMIATMYVPASIGGSVSSGVHALLRPADAVEVPIIDPNSPELHEALATLPPIANPSHAPHDANAGPLWPMHGAITTYFGVPHRPYQVTHSGIDISDGARPGVTPIKPFRPGRVIDVVWTNKGLGNHVVVDHGSGITSVYAHLHTIAAHIGQEVSLDTVLGTEGTTGVSTGVHLHFEIRVNGQATDPRQFIDGNP
ncbi:MAG TPA: M23 family metallopeptidase [Candidatus Saccharimonadales bacterium]|nr:M23 family metallopeptidase [Candidatus Saccharimonadales bacterium]